MALDPKQFFQALEKFVEEVEYTAEENGVVLQKKTAVEIGKRAARDTPIDTGKATANWTISINSEDTSDKQLFDQSQSASPTVKRMESAAASLRYGDDIYLSNGVTGEGRESESLYEESEDGYIVDLENGHSKQAPNGMFQKHVVSVENIVRGILG